MMTATVDDDVVETETAEPIITDDSCARWR